MKTEQIVKVGILYNAFDPSKVEMHELMYRKNTKLKTYLHDLPKDCEWKIGLNGKPVTLEEHGNIRLRPNDTIQLVVVPQGDGGKDILRMLALVAIVVVAAILFVPSGGASAPLGFALFGSVTAGMALGMTLFTLAGGLLINALLPPKAMKVDNEESNSYSYDGAKNTAKEGVALPVVYGKYRVAGNYVDLYTEQVGDIQYMYGRTVLSDGEITNVSDPYLNDQPIANFTDIEWDWRAGTGTDEPKEWFNRSVTQYTKNSKLIAFGSGVIHTTLNEIDQFSFDVYFPKGLIYVDYKGRKYNRNCVIGIDYRLTGTTTWTSLPDLSIWDTAQKVVRRTYESPILPARADYDIRIRKISPEGDPDHACGSNGCDDHALDECWVGSVGEIINSEISHATVANSFYKAKMSEQLSGVPNITWLVEGVKVNRYDINGNITEKTWTDNPAWIILDMLIGEERGTPGLYQIDYPSFLDWADWCEDQGLKFNGVFDTTTTLWDATVDVLKIGHATFTRVGTKLSVAVDKPQEPVMLFGPGNIFKDTFTITYVAMNDRANEFELSYFDRDDMNNQKTIRVVDPDAEARGEIPRAVSFSVPGIDNFEQAQKELWYNLYNNRYIRRTIGFDAPIESIGLAIGDVALIQHDIVNWGVAGRTEDSTSLVINLDKPIVMEDDNEYSLLAILNSVTRGTGSFVNKMGNVVVVSSVIGTDIVTSKCKRLVQGSVDRQILSITETSGTYYVTISGDNDFGGIGTIEFVDTDVIEERNVVYLEGEHSSVSLSSPFSSVLPRYTNYMFGNKQIVKKPYRLRAVNGTGFDSRQLTFVEYNEAIYNEPEHIVPYPTTTAPKLVKHVTDLTFVADYVSAYDNTMVTGTLAWNTQNVKDYGGVDIYISVDQEEGDGFSLYQTVFNANQCQILTKNGSNVVFKVVAFNTTLTRAPSSTAPTYAILVESQPARVSPPENLSAEQISYIATSLIGVTWDAPSDLTSTEADKIRYRVQVKPDGETTWDEYGVTDQTNIRVGDLVEGTHIVRVRSELGASYSDWVEDGVVAEKTDDSLSNGTGDLVPPGVPTALSATSAITEIGAKLSISWTPPADTDIAGYVVAISEGSGSYIEFFTSTNSYSIDGLLRNQLYHVKVKTFDKSNNYSGFTSVLDVTTSLDTTPPSAPSGFAAAAAFQTIFLSWNNPSDADLAGIEVYASATDDSSTATVLANLTALPATVGKFTHSALAPLTTRYYWLKAVDSSGNKSSFSTGISASTLQVGTGGLAANSVTADKILAGEITGEKFNTGTSLPGTITVGTTGVEIGTIQSQADDPAARVNAKTTQIDPGKILISGSTTLASWRNGSDNTKIEGGNIAANTISANKLTIGNRGISFIGLNFEWNPLNNYVYWTEGFIYYTDSSNNYQAEYIAAGNSGGVSSHRWFYWTPGTGIIQMTQTNNVAANDANIMIAAWWGGSNLNVNYGGTIINGDRITTNTISANRIVSGSIFTQSLYVGNTNIFLDGGNARIIISD